MIYQMIYVFTNDFGEVKLPEGQRVALRSLPELSFHGQDISGCSSGTSTPFLGTKYYRRHGSGFDRKKIQGPEGYHEYPPVIKHG